jgi:hypothetical protein
MAVFSHLFVTGYEERALRRRFGAAYTDYRQAVPRWIPRPPRHSQEPDPPGRGLPPPARTGTPDGTNSEVSR